MCHPTLELDSVHRDMCSRRTNQRNGLCGVQVKEKAILANRWAGHAGARNDDFESEQLATYKSGMLEFVAKSLDEDETVKAERSLVRRPPAGCMLESATAFEV